jgi:hypothetical protein
VRIFEGCIIEKGVAKGSNMVCDDCIHRQLTVIHDVQLILDEMGAVIKVLPHLAKPSDRIAKEVLAFVCIMLFNANADVQVFSFSIKLTSVVYL